MATEATDFSRLLMQQIDAEIAHVWMVRTFLKHSDEVKDDEELASVHRDLYDFMLALGPSLDAGDSASYLQAGKEETFAAAIGM